MFVCQHPLLLQALKLYECQAAARLPAGSAGSNWLHMLMSLEKDRPPSMSTFFAPVPRTAVTSCCMPATGRLLPALSRSMLPQAVPPSRQHVQLGAPLPRKKSGNGSLNRSKIVAVSFSNVFATDVQNSTAVAASGMGFWQIACEASTPRVLEGTVQASSMLLYTPSVQCRSRMATRPCRCRVATYAWMAEM